LTTIENEEKGNLSPPVIRAKVSCRCSYNITHVFETPKTYLEYFNWTGTLSCPDCKTKDLLVIPEHQGEGKDRREEAAQTEENEFKSKAQKVLELAETNCTKLFTDQFDIAHAALAVNAHTEILPLKSSRFKNWLARLAYKEGSLVVDTQTIKDVTGILTAKALFEGEQKSLALRVATIKDSGNWYYDLTNSKWEFVEITNREWNIVSDGLIIFHRYSQLPQAYPSKEYPSDIFDKFMDILNISGNENRLLLKVYIISMFIPEIPKVILMLHGEQGSAKTTLEELIKMLVDPSIAKTFAFPRDVNEFIQQLSHNYVTFYDNISIIKDWISDLLCRAATGSAFSKRMLYTDDEDFIYSLKRCVGFNGINLGASKADLLDRGVIIQLERVRKDKWRKIEDIWKEFEQIRPQLLGYIFDILVKVKKWRDEGTPLNITLSRMADWTEHAEIIARCMGYKENDLVKAYYKNTEIQIGEVIESSPIAIALIDFMTSLSDDKQEQTNTPTTWLNILKAQADSIGIDTKAKSWPKGPQIMSRRLKELKTSLRERSIEVEWLEDPKTKGRIIKVCKIPSIPYIPPTNENQAQNSKHVDATVYGIGGIDDTLHNIKETSQCEKCGETLDPDPYYAKLHKCTSS